MLRDFKFCTHSLVMSECSLSGRGQGHVSNFYTVDIFLTLTIPLLILPLIVVMLTLVLSGRGVTSSALPSILLHLY